MDRLTSLLVVSLLTCFPLFAQWLNYPTKGIPRTREGKPNLSAPAPRAADGKPDLSGIWAVEETRPNQFLDIAPDANGRPYNRLPYRPGMAELAKRRDTPPKTTEPHSQCLPD